MTVYSLPPRLPAGLGNPAPCLRFCARPPMRFLLPRCPRLATVTSLTGVPSPLPGSPCQIPTPRPLYKPSPSPLPAGTSASSVMSSVTRCSASRHTIPERASSGAVSACSLGASARAAHNHPLSSLLLLLPHGDLFTCSLLLLTDPRILLAAYDARLHQWRHPFPSEHHFRSCRVISGAAAPSQQLSCHSCG